MVPYLFGKSTMVMALRRVDHINWKLISTSDLRALMK